VVRSELHVAFVNQQELTLPSYLCNIDRSLGDTDDDTWAWRIILHYRDCLAYSLGPSNTNKFDELSRYSKQWFKEKAETFEPTLLEEADEHQGRWFPEIWYLEDCHGTLPRLLLGPR
jgi:hypothetical protein